MTTRAALLFLLSAAPVAAQQNLLQRADSLLIAGQYEPARAALAGWERANPTTASTEPSQRARALYLTARLTTDAAKAQELYLTIALSFPTTRDAPDALLRVGQSFFASGDAPRAVTYLQRLINDYPSAAARSQGFLWLTRAQIAAGKNTLACTTAGTALKSAQNTAEIASLLAAEERSACSGSAPEPPRAAVPDPVVRRTEPPRSAPERDTTRALKAESRYAIQVAAFRELRSANTIAAQLRRAGHDARVAFVEGSALARVRVGRFETHAAAVAEVRRLKAAHVDGIVVADATRERAAR
ncbi:MAG: SPOR domain-containing protein [Gemmatimonadota bacterium]